MEPNNTYHIMLDIETMGTDHNAAIVAIGAVKFNKDGVIGEPFYVPVDLESAMSAGGTVTGSTIQWWLKQSDAARIEITSGGMPIERALVELSDYIRPTKGGALAGVWGNGATFDNIIVASAYKAVGFPLPWTYRQDRCYRTIMALVPKPNVASVGTAHKAVDDAMYQAQCLVATGVLS